MKSLFAFIICLSFASSAFAGWGAIAYSPSTSTSAESHGYDCYVNAVNAALAACGYSDCYIINWEENACNAFATGPNGAWGEAHGFADASSAINAALAYCGPWCGWRAWMCN